MRVFLDTNIILDKLLNREENLFYTDQVIRTIPLKDTYIAAITVNNAYYVSKPKSIQRFSRLMLGFNIIEVNTQVFESAFKLDMNDFEDAIQLTCALNVECEYLITWNTKDYRQHNSKIKVISPKEFVELDKI